MNTHPSNSAQEPTEEDRKFVIRLFGATIALSDLEAYQSNCVETRRYVASEVAKAVADKQAEIDRLKAQGDDYTYQRECFEALQLIPIQFVESDYWVNGIKRMAEAMKADRAAIKTLREALVQSRDANCVCSYGSTQVIAVTKANEALDLTAHFDEKDKT